MQYEKEVLCHACGCKLCPKCRQPRVLHFASDGTCPTPPKPTPEAPEPPLECTECGRAIGPSEGGICDLCSPAPAHRKLPAGMGIVWACPCGVDGVGLRRLDAHDKTCPLPVAERQGQP